jgi:hypothetical protein
MADFFIFKFLASRESSAQRGLPDSSSSIGLIKLEVDSTDELKGVSCTNVNERLRM